MCGVKQFLKQVGKILWVNYLIELDLSIMCIEGSGFKAGLQVYIALLFPTSFTSSFYFPTFLKKTPTIPTFLL